MRLFHRKPEPEHEFTGTVQIKFADLPSKAQALITAHANAFGQPLTGIEKHWLDVALQEAHAQEAERNRKLRPLLAAIDQKERELGELRSRLYELEPAYGLANAGMGNYGMSSLAQAFLGRGGIIGGGL